MWCFPCLSSLSFALFYFPSSYHVSQFYAYEFHIASGYSVVVHFSDVALSIFIDCFVQHAFGYNALVPRWDAGTEITAQTCDLTVKMLLWSVGLRNTQHAMPMLRTSCAPHSKEEMLKRRQWEKFCMVRKVALESWPLRNARSTTALTHGWLPPLPGRGHACIVSLGFVSTWIDIKGYFHRLTSWANYLPNNALND